MENSNSEEPNDAIGGIAALTFLQSLSSATGIDDLVNPPNARLVEKMIFEVKTEGLSQTPARVWVSLATENGEGEQEKEEKKKDGNN